MLSIKEIVKATNGNLLNGNTDYIPKDYVLDSRNITGSPFFIPIVGEKTDGHKYIVNAVKSGICGYFINKTYDKKDNVIKESKIVNKDIVIIEVDDTLEALYSAGKYNREKHIEIPVVGVTGSVGKTSTREMIASVLKKSKNVLTTKFNYNSIIGAPIMALQIENQDICVFEMGTDHAGEIEKLADLLKPNIAVITMIGTAHIGNFGSRENIFKEKIQITSHMKKGSHLIINGDDDLLKNMHSNDIFDVITYSNSDIINIEETIDSTFFETKIYGEIQKIEIDQIGTHNAKNAVCAIRVAECLGFDKKDIIDGIHNYKNYLRRLEVVKIKNDIVLIDDTYNASLDSMRSGLNTVNNLEGKRKIAVLGDMLELGEFSSKLHGEVGKLFKDLNYDMLYVLGEESKYIAKEAKSYINVKEFNDIENLVLNLKNELKPGDIVYLKASNGMHFNKIIDQIKE